MDDRTWQAFGHLASSASWPGFCVLCMYVHTYLQDDGANTLSLPTSSSLIRSSAHYICRFYLLPYFQTNRLKVYMKFPRKYTGEKKKSTWIGNSRTCICYCSNIYQVTPAIIIISTYQIFQNPQRKFKKKKKKKKVTNAARASPTTQGGATSLFLPPFSHTAAVRTY